MAQTPEQLQALKRMMGEDYVPPADSTDVKDANGDGQTTIDNPPITADGSVTPPATDQPVITAPQQFEMDDAKVLEYLKKKNINLQSLDELAPKADPTDVAEKREAAKLSFGIGQSLFSKKEYDSFVTDSNAPENLVFSEYVKEARDEDPDISDEDIRSEFNEKYGLDYDESSRKFKRGVSEIALLANKILSTKYGKIYAADQRFTEHEREVQSQTERNARILADTPRYKADVESIITELKNHKIKINDKDDFPVNFSDEYLQVLRGRFFDPLYVEDLIEKGYSKELLSETIFLGAIKENLPQLMSQYADHKQLIKQAGTRGIVNVHVGTQKEDQSTLNEKQQKAKSHYENVLKQTPLAN